MMLPRYSTSRALGDKLAADATEELKVGVTARAHAAVLLELGEDHLVPFKEAGLHYPGGGSLRAEPIAQVSDHSSADSDEVVIREVPRRAVHDLMDPADVPAVYAPAASLRASPCVEADG
jgi:hypothetical protein